jgi:hypothetical protein
VSIYLLSNKFMSSTHTESQTHFRRVYQTKSLNLGGSVSPFPYHCFPLSPSPSTPLQGHLPLPRPLQAQSTSSPSGGGPEWSTPRSFHCSHIQTLMLDNGKCSLCHLSSHWSSLFLVEHSSNMFSCWIVIIFSRLINHINRKKTSVCIQHTVFATFTTLANKNI